MVSGDENANQIPTIEKILNLTKLQTNYKNTLSFRSSMMNGLSRLRRYEALENLNPGTISSVTAAPPRTSLNKFVPVRHTKFA